MHEFSRQRETLTYRYGNIDTPFLDSNQNEDRELGALSRSAHYWKIISFIGISCSFLLLLCVLVKLMQPEIRVFYAEVLPNGSVKNTGLLLTQSKYDQVKSQ